MTWEVMTVKDEMKHDGQQKHETDLMRWDEKT